MESTRFMVALLYAYRSRAMLAGTALLMSTTALVVFGQGLRYLVDHGFGTDDDMLIRALLALLGVTFLMAVASAIRYYLFTWLGEKIAADLRERVFSHLLTLSPAFFDTQRTGSVLSALNADTLVIQNGIGSSLSLALRNILALLGGCAMLALTSAKLFLVVLIGLPLTVLPLLRLGRKVRQLARHTQDRLADVGACADETFHAIRTVQAFGHESEDRRQFHAVVDRAFHSAMQRAGYRAVLMALAIVLVFAAICMILWLGGQEVLAQRMSTGTLSAFAFYALMVAMSFAAITEVWNELQRTAAAVDRIREQLMVVPDVRSPDHPLFLPLRHEGRVEFINVSFAYPSRPSHPVLENFSLVVEPGETLALVGPSGAGKTTVLQLLLRFYDPGSGSIRFDGIDIRQLDLQALRGKIGLVPQDPVIFATSAWNNIRYGQCEASDADVRDAAAKAHVSEFLESQADGFDTHLGERGVRLSGGQRQRVAIARALMRAPVLLLLDEATSALDAESERLVQESLQAATRNRTCIVIAHKLATVMHADRIAVMDRGSVIATGTHDSLRKACRLYDRLAALNFAESPVSVPVDPTLRKT